MSRAVAVRSTRAVLPSGVGPATVVVDGERIGAVLPYDADVPGEVNDWGDDALLPGLVDTHVHLNEPGRTTWEGFASGTTAAARGGVTTLIDMPLNSLPPTLDVPSLATKRAAAAGKCRVDVGFWGGAVPASLRDSGELAKLHEAGVFGFKCFLADSGVPEFPPVSGDELRRLMKLVRQNDALLIVHAEDPAHIGDAGPAYRDFLASRPARVETSAIGLLADLAAEYDARVHVLHLSSADALATIAGARRSGVRMTAETCPHYLVLAAEEVPDGATEFKCCPPIRERENADRLWQGLLDGTIDCIVSDHSPSEPSLKHTGGFDTAWGGIAGLQLGLPLIWSEALVRGRDLTDVVRWMAEGPARLAGLGDRGRIEAGRRADLVRFAPEHSWTVRGRDLAHRHPITPYDRRTLHGVVVETWLAGAPVVEERPTGRLIEREAVA